MSDTDVLMEVAPSPARRWMAILALGILAILLISLAFNEVTDVWRAVFVLLGCGALWGANTLRLSTMDALILTREGLFTASGKALVPVENIAKVERGVFAFKPSNGFLVRLKEPGEKSWALGLYWLSGRRLGVGGTLSGGQTRAMADLMSAMIIERDGTE